MTPIKTVGAAIATLGILAGGSVLLAPQHPNDIIKRSFRGIPVGTVMQWDNGKYVPQSVPGYESKADYPDSFWVYDPQNMTSSI